MRGSALKLSLYRIRRLSATDPRSFETYIVVGLLNVVALVDSV